MKDDSSQSLEKYRSFLRLVAEAQLPPLLRGRVEPSDVVQQTLLEAHADREQARGQEDPVRMAWLRRILVNNLANAVRDLQRAKRDVRREKPFEDLVQRSSANLEGWLAAEQSSPSQAVEKADRVLLLSGAFEALPHDQQRALVLRYWHDWSLADIADDLGRTPSAVAGLLHRGLRKLRSMLRDLE